MSKIDNAKWIRSKEHKAEAVYVFKADYELKGKIKSASLSVSSMGLYIAYINGKRVGEEILTPYFTEYTKRIQYQQYDVTDMLDGSFELSVVCAEGWAVGRIRAGAVHTNHYADHISLIYSIDIELENGEKISLYSDEDVRVFTSHITRSSIYDGETVDKTACIADLGNAVYDKDLKATLVPQQGERVIEHEVLKPISYIVTPKGERVLDFGQNLAGYVRLRTKGNRGDVVEISHAEVLDSDGNFYTDNLRSAKQTNRYILSGEADEFKPSFSWQGFRYIRLDKYPFDEVDLSSFEAVVVHSDIRRTGNFECGNAKINQLYSNIIWGQKSNFIDIPTDCPQRDERLGWTGDAQIFVRTAAINFDVERFFEKWLADLALVQFDDGGVGWLVPSCNLHYTENVASGWGDAATICPWEIYLAYGNDKILKNQFESMKKWVEYIRSFGDEEFLWLGGKQFGDWLAMDNGEGEYNGATPYDYISSVYYAYSTALLAKAGQVLGYDMTEYEELYRNIVKSFKERFTKDGVPTAKTQTAFAMALYFELCDDKKKTADGLAKLIEENDKKLTTGFLGTPYLLHALSQNGYAELAYDLLLQEEFPSWLFSVNQGATTMWEHWDGLKTDGTFWDPKMNSFNHYAYGAVYDWIFGACAGIKVLEDGAGYKHIEIRPFTDKRLGFLNAEIDTGYGKIKSSWRYKDDRIIFDFEIPKGVTAEIILPEAECDTVCGGQYTYETKLQ